jgi:hypothetical protein
MPRLFDRFWTRFAADVALWIAIGVVMAFLGPFGSSQRPLPERFVYWQLCMVGGGLIGIAIDTPLRKLLSGFWPRLLTVSVLMTAPVTGLVALVNHYLSGMRLGPPTSPRRGSRSSWCASPRCACASSPGPSRRPSRRPEPEADPLCASANACRPSAGRPS